MQQLYDKLESMKRFGVSRKFLKENGLADEAITSVSTMKTYKKVGKRFITYMKGKHPNVTTLKKMKKYVPEYLQSRADLAADGKLSARSNLRFIPPSTRFSASSPKTPCSSTRSRQAGRKSNAPATRSAAAASRFSICFAGPWDCAA